jgi:hypothetical protein
MTVHTRASEDIFIPFFPYKFSLELRRNKKVMRKITLYDAGSSRTSREDANPKSSLGTKVRQQTIIAVSILR